MAHSLTDIAYRAVTSPVRLLPDFIVIGAQRGGTSAFYYHLSEHPSFVVSPTKELNYFNKNYHKGPLWYRAHFPTLAEKRRMEQARQRALITGEASPDYLVDPLAPQRAAATAPNAKLIVLLRDPAERAYSHYRLYVQIGRETRPFAEAIALDEQRLREVERNERDMADGGAPAHFYYGYDSYIGRGRYADQLHAWLRLFPREHFLFLRSEDFYANPVAVFNQALAFLGISPEGLPEKASYAHYDGYSCHPEQRGDTGMSATLREHLRAYFAPHNARLYDLLGRDMGWG